MKKQILVIQHDKGDPPGLLLDWSLLRCVNINIVTLFNEQKLPAPSEAQNIVSLGGPMNVDQHDLYPWLKVEKDFLSKCIEDSQKRILGLCLGGQLLARCLGAKVVKHKHKEIGWHQIQKVNEHPSLAEWPSESVFFQYHEDKFEIPQNAQRIFKNDICENQGFQYKDHVIGLQFHPEATEQWAHECIAELPENYKKLPYVQLAESAYSQEKANANASKVIFYSFLDRFFKI